MKALLASVLGAFAYFSAIPVPRASAVVKPAPPVFSALPLVGAVIGLVAGAVGYGAALASSALVGDAVAFTLVIVLSGAIHLDGFLDSCDAVFATASPQRRLEILKDPRHGTFALTGLALLLVWWLAALGVTHPKDLPLRLAFACALARAAATVPVYAHRYARQRPSSVLEYHPSRTRLIVTIAILAVVSVAVSTIAWIAIPLSVLAATAAARWMSGRLGGLVGDSYGFMISILEPFILLGLSATLS